MLHGRWPDATRCGLTAALLLLLAIALLTTIVSAQEGALTVNVSGLDGSDWPAGQAVVTVLDADGRPVSGLDQAAFEVSLDGTGAPVTEVAQGVDSTLPISVVLVLDVSGSMAEGGAIDRAKEAAQRFLGSLGPDDSVAVMTFDETVHLVQDFTKDKPAADRAIAGLSTGSTTALYPATADSVQLAGSAEGGRRAIVLLSDGGLGVLAGTVTEDAALAAAQNAGVPVFAIGLGNEIDRQYLGELAQRTGGRFAETPSPEGLDALYQEASELLRGQYILTIDGSGITVAEGRALALSVTAASAAGAGTGERQVCLHPLCVSLSATEGQRIGDAQTVTATVISTDQVESVALLVDGSAVQTIETPPYDFTFDPGGLASGDHTLAARVKTGSGEDVLGTVQVRTGGEAAFFSSGSVLIGALAAGVVLILVAFALFWRGRRSGEAHRAGGNPSDPAPFFAEPKARRELLWQDEPDLPAEPELEAARGLLHVTSGELAGQSFSIGAKPVSIGTGHRCRITLEDPDGLQIGAEHARVWIRDDHLMLHELRRLSSFGPAGGRWAILSPGDTFAIGPYTFRFDLAGAALEAPADPAPDAPVSSASAAPRPLEPATNVVRWHDDPAQTPPEPVPNVLRSRDEQAPETPPEPLPNVLRSRDEQAPETPPEAVPNILRSPDEQAPETPPEPVPNILRSPDEQAPETPPEPVPNILRSPDEQPADPSDHGEPSA